MKLKVLHVINSMGVGGAEVLLANSLAADGLQNHTDNVLAFINGSSWLTGLIDKRVTVYDLGFRGMFSLPGILLRLRKIILEHKIDIVHTHLTQSGILTSLILPGHVKQIHTVHTTYSLNSETTRTLKWLEKKLLFNNKNQNIICLSDYTKDDFIKATAFKGKVFILNNFVRDTFFNLPAPHYLKERDTLKLIAVGALMPRKNSEFLLKVFKHLKDYPISLDIYGGNGDLERYEKIIQSGNLKIRMMGVNKDLHKVIAKYDLFISSSIFEGFPLSVFEAMATGLPLLLSNLDSHRTIVKEHAMYFDFDAKKVADTILSIFEKRIDINTLAVNARRYAEETVKREKYISRLLDIYATLK